MMVLSKLFVSNAKASILPIPGRAYGMIGGVLPSPERLNARFDRIEVTTRVRTSIDRRPTATVILKSHCIAAAPWSRISSNMLSRRLSGAR